MAASAKLEDLETFTENVTGPGRYSVKSEHGRAVSQESDLEADREPVTWIETHALTSENIKRITSLQLFTYSHDGSHDTGKLSAGFWTWFEIRVREDGNETPRKLPNGQSLIWQSHYNRFFSREYEWRRGRLFTKDDEILKHLKKGDVISVVVRARFNLTNHARSGHLVVGLGPPEFYSKPLELPPPDRVPAIWAYAQKRRECLMLPADGPSRKTAILDGGVDLLERLLQNKDNSWTVRGCSLGEWVPDPDSSNVHSVIELEKFKVKANDKAHPSPSFRTVKQYTLPGESRSNNAENPVPRPKLIVWSDDGVNKDSIAKPDADVLIYQMSAPLWKGELWEAAKTASKNSLVVIVIDADDLRAQGLHISRGLSWERTMEDFRAYLAVIMKEPSDNIHLLVRCGYEGAFYVPPNPRFKDPKQPVAKKHAYACSEAEGGWGSAPHKKQRFVCYMVPDRAEGGLLEAHNGRMPGIDMAFIAALSASLVREPMDSLNMLGRTQMGVAVRQALIWSQRFASIGFRKDADGKFHYPRAEDLDLDTLPKTNVIYGGEEEMLTVLEDTDDKIADGELIERYRNNGKDFQTRFIEGNWSLFTQLRGFGMQFNVDLVKLESTKWLEASVPTARFGNLLTADRTEIECFRSTAAAVHEYLGGKSKRPMSIAVFGPPGAGKSFGAKEVIQAVVKACGGDPEVLEANLSQFLEHSDLVTTFRAIRDISLKNKVPVVLFDEFDAVFKQQELGWLKYFLAPMWDGEFLESGHRRPMGRAIFVFIGGTSSTFEEFTKDMPKPEKKKKKDIKDKHDPKKQQEEKERQERIHKAKQAKQPDFVSRLSAYIDVQGPNKTRQGDEMFTFRRAIILRGLLERRLAKEKKDISVDDKILDELLRHDCYRHGARSLELILQLSRLSNGHRLEAAAFPSDKQLGMHMDIGEYRRSMRPEDDESLFALAEDEPLRPIDAPLRLKLMWAEILQNGRVKNN
ncbi:hypothetical protein NM208_g273 [Fusarium decemcellulare]|uniref:Uncharacterized protein n=2 Tax=Fusarium decemcellulare TaxID=57161 RepID=A0ACC1T0D1_9HYPO|nr:hypothetical protein NM208_g3072 [Fusarium decemcellulare]KAJ3549880.1 hypothetical protein NM208_g273 [Fusarium decemcellulare]